MKWIKCYGNALAQVLSTQPEEVTDQLTFAVFRNSLKNWKYQICIVLGWFVSICLQGLELFVVVWSCRCVMIMIAWRKWLLKSMD